MPDTTYRDVVVRIALKQIQSRLEAVDTKAVDEKLEHVDRTVEQVSKNIDEYGKELTQAYKETAAAINKVTQEQEELTKIHLEAVDNNIKVADSLKTAGEGAFTLARGLAFVSASTEEDFQQALKTIAQVQGAFDIFKGLIDTTKGIAEARKALMIVTKAATTAEALHTGAMMASEVAAVQLTAVLKALRTAALGPIGIALAAGGAVVGGIYLLSKAFGDSEKASDKFRSSVEKTNDKLKEQEQIAKDRVNRLQKEAGLLHKIASIEAEGALERAGLIIDPRRRARAARRLAEEAMSELQNLQPAQAITRVIREATEGALHPGSPFSGVAARRIEAQPAITETYQPQSEQLRVAQRRQQLLEQFEAAKQLEFATADALGQSERAMRQAAEVMTFISREQEIVKRRIAEIENNQKQGAL